VCVCVCVCVVLVKSMLWGPKVPTKIVIPIIFDHVGTFFGPHEEKELIIQNDVF